MTVDELLANPAIDLPSGTIPLSAIILIEYETEHYRHNHAHQQPLMGEPSLH